MAQPPVPAPCRNSRQSAELVVTLSLVAAGLALTAQLALALSLVGLLAMTSSSVLFAFNAGRSFLLFQLFQVAWYFLYTRAVPVRHLALVAAMLLTILIGASTLLAWLVPLLALAISFVLLTTLILFVLHCAHAPSDIPVGKGRALKQLCGFRLSAKAGALPCKK